MHIRPSLVFTLVPLAGAFDWAHHPRLRRTPRLPDSATPMSTPALPSATPSLLPSLSLPLSFSSPTSADATPESTPPTTSTPEPTPSPESTSPPASTSSPSSTSSPASTVPLVSSTAPSPTGSSAATPTSSDPTTPTAVGQPSSSSTPTTVAAGAGLSTPESSSVVVISSDTSSGTATPSSTATQSSSSGFFSNSGAVAGTFTVAGLVGVASVIAVVLLIVRRRRSRIYEEDAEFLDKTPDLSADPPMRQVISPDGTSSSGHGYFTAPPMALASPPTAYYPDHTYTLHPQAFPAEGNPPPASHVYTPAYPVGYAQDYPAQRIYSPEDYDIAYPPPVSRVDTNMPNPHGFADVELDSAPVPPTQATLPNALRPSVNSTPTATPQWASTRYSVDSFYAGIVTDTPISPGQAL